MLNRKGTNKHISIAGGSPDMLVSNLPDYIASNLRRERNVTTMRTTGLATFLF
jgi:hypothetical protein